MTDAYITVDPTIDAVGELSTSEARLCPGCGRPEALWRENGGSGYEGADGGTYCCRGCADETGCTCG
jgi:hypothetical protein